MVILGRRNGENMKKVRRHAAVVCLTMVLLAGCDSAKMPEVVDSTTVSVEEDGRIRYWLVGEFDKDYYEISELNEMAVGEAQQFNAERKSATGSTENTYPVIVEKVETAQTNEGLVVVHYRFDGWQSYSDFNEEDLFYGTIGEAVAEGYNVEIQLNSVKEDSPLTGENVKNATDRYVIITNVKADVYCPGKVTHISEGAVLNADGSVDTTGTDGQVYILIK